MSTGEVEINPAFWSISIALNFTAPYLLFETWPIDLWLELKFML